MEIKSKTTDKGDLNRWIRAANNLLRARYSQKISVLTDWLKKAKAELNKPQPPNIADLLNTYYTARNAGAWSRNARIGNLKEFAEVFNYMVENQLFTLEDLENRVQASSDKTDTVKASMKGKSARTKELEELLCRADTYRELKTVYDEMNAIKWKRKREKFKSEHENDLKIFYMTRRKLEKHFTPAGEIPAQTWRQELTKLQGEYKAEYEQYKPMQDDLMKLLQVKNCVDTALRQQEQLHEKRQEAER